MGINRVSVDRIRTYGRQEEVKTSLELHAPSVLRP